MDILFLGKMIPEEIEQEVRRKSKRTMQDAAISLQRRMIEGIEKNIGTDIRIINKMILNSYPKYYEDAFVKEFKYSHNANGKKQDVNLGFLNICYLKYIFKCFSLKKHLKEWLLSVKNESAIVTYTVDVEFLSAVKYAKKKNPNIKSCVVIADLPEFIDLSDKRSLAKKIYGKVVNYCANKYLCKYIDSYVLLTEQMADKMDINKPYVVVEGIATDSFQKNAEKENSNIKTVFYAGTLHKKFGIIELLDAFKLIDDANYRLVICGTGDSEDIVKERMREDKRIEFLSILPRELVLEKMQDATVIVNPRQNNAEFTKYSFPSKNLEALSSGVPLVAYKLDGIPDDYDNYINYVNGSRPMDLAKKITEVCEAGDKRIIMGNKAREFVLSNKNAKRQMEKMIVMLKNSK